MSAPDQVVIDKWRWFHEHPGTDHRRSGSETYERLAPILANVAKVISRRPPLDSTARLVSGDVLPALSGASTLDGMSAERDELRRLVEEIPDEEVPAALADLRRHLRSVSDRPWPPAFFGSATSTSPHVSSRVDEILAEGFGCS